MTEKRFTYDSKTVSILQDGEFWLDGNVDTACNHSEICNELNKLADENEQLKPFVEYEKRQHKHWKRECLENIKEIAQLKREIAQLKGDVG